MVKAKFLISFYKFLLYLLIDNYFIAATVTFDFEALRQQQSTRLLQILIFSTKLSLCFNLNINEQ